MPRPGWLPAAAEHGCYRCPPPAGTRSEARAAVATIRLAMETGARSPLRFLAPAALAVAAVIFVVVIYASIGAGEPSGTDSASETAPGGGGGGGGGGQGGQGGGQDGGGEDTYEVQEGDTLDGIAAETGVPVEQILELNPDLDPQSLAAGEEIQLRE